MKITIHNPILILAKALFSLLKKIDLKIGRDMNEWMNEWMRILNTMIRSGRCSPSQ